jgi:hypothetical protein
MTSADNTRPGGTREGGKPTQFTASRRYPQMFLARHSNSLAIRLGGICLLLLSAVTIRATAEERFEAFDRDPGWEGVNYRSDVPRRTVEQHFGYSRTQHAGGSTTGEIGGRITPAGEAAYYARRISPGTLEQPLSASGKLACTGQQFHVLIAFFQAGTVNEWRTPNTIAVRLYGRGDVFYAFVEYATSRWRAGGDSPQPFAHPPDPATGRRAPLEFDSQGTVHQWSLTYDPSANNGGGRVTATIDDQVAICDLDPGHKADGARFDHFGLMNVIKHHDDGGELWLDDITVNGELESFDRDPGWDAFQNHRTYETSEVRPRFDFGFSPTHFAGGQRAGELGGLVFRGDNRYAEKMACYADRLQPLSLRQTLRASGRIALNRAVSDSTTLIGFFHSRRSMLVNDSQSSGVPDDFVGMAIEGPSREGFFVYPIYRVAGRWTGHASNSAPPRIFPDGQSHAWHLDYDPATADGRPRMTLRMNGDQVVLEMEPEVSQAEARLDRFGLITTWIDGNGQRIYFDDLRYTCRQ